MADGLMLDTTVFNHILRDGTELSRIPTSSPSYVTHIQRDEINASQDTAKRAKLLSIFTELPTSRISTSFMVWGLSNWDESNWSPEDDLFEQLLSTLNNCNNSKDNNKRDVLIAETAIRNKYILVTDDDLSETVSEYGGEVLTLMGFIRN